MYINNLFSYCLQLILTANVANHLRFAAVIKFGKMSVASAEFKLRCKMSGGFSLLCNTEETIRLQA